MAKNPTYFDVIYHNAITDNEFHAQHIVSTLADAFEAAWAHRKPDEYVYITNPETGETFLTYDGSIFTVVPEV